MIRKRVIQILKQFLERNKKLNLNEPFEWPVLDPIVKFENRSDKVKTRLKIESIKLVFII